MKTSKILIASLFMGLGFGAVQMRADDPKFMRSSIYSVLINSNDQNSRLDKEANDADPNGYNETLQAAGLQNLTGVPSSAFEKLTIPEQFNNHNLDVVIVDYDELVKGISADEAKAARPKGGGAGNFMKSLGASALSGGNNSTFIHVEPVDDYMHAVMNKFFANNKTAPMLVAKWYNYGVDSTSNFNTGLIVDRGIENASAAELAHGAADENFKARLNEQGFELINNTYVVATNLRFRNNKALAKEISELAEAAAGVAANQSGLGGLGGLAALGAKKATEAIVNGLMKDMYSVTAVTNLYKLDWNNDLNEKLAEDILYNENATLEDLLNNNLLKLSYVGQTKARSGVKKDKKKNLSQLAESATARAIDKALAKLQVEYDVFRTTVPISESNEGFVYAKIGTKEGVTPGDEYDILERQVDPKTSRVSFKKVASAKVEKDAVWFNTTGADELIANADEKEASAMKAAQALGKTKLKANKKDYEGYYLRLAKKKGKIEDN